MTTAAIKDAVTRMYLQGASEAELREVREHIEQFERDASLILRLNAFEQQPAA